MIREHAYRPLQRQRSEACRSPGTYMCSDTGAGQFKMSERTSKTAEDKLWQAAIAQLAEGRDGWRGTSSEELSLLFFVCVLVLATFYHPIGCGLYASNTYMVESTARVSGVARARTAGRCNYCSHAPRIDACTSSSRSTL